MAAFEQSDYLVDNTPFNQTRLGGFFARVRESLRQAVIRNQTRTALERLSNRQLADIGLSRKQIEEVALLAGRP